MNGKRKIPIRILALLLSALMLFTIVPLSAFAAGDGMPENADTQDEVEYQATNAVGAMLLNASQENDAQGSSGYAIQSVTIKGPEATAEVVNADACTLVVAIYDNDGEMMLGSGKTELMAKETLTNDIITVSIAIDAMPTYFYVKAFLLDENYKPLCHQYETKEYTKEFEEFMAKTTDDFAEERVINLDESDENNFLVVSDKAAVIESVAGENTVTTDDYENGVYVIENANSDITNLEPGEIFYYQYGSGADDYILAEVGAIDIDGTTVTITAGDIEELTDVFQYAKIDTEATETTFDGAEMDADVTHETVEIGSARSRAISLGGEASVEDKWAATKTFDDGSELSFSVWATLKMSCKVYIDFELWGNKYFYFEDVLTYNSGIDATAKGTVAALRIPLGTLGLDTNAGIKADVKVSFIMELTVELTVHFTLMDGAFGNAYDSNIGIIDKSHAAGPDVVPEIKNEATGFIGLSFKAELQATKNIKSSLEARIGLKATAELSILDNGDDDVKHDCSLCVDGDITFLVNCKFKLKIYDILDKEETLGEIFVYIGDFYYSLDNGFGWGDCPNVRYKVTVSVKDADGEALSGVTINGTYTTGSDGTVVLYLKNGTHTITAKDESGEEESKEITITDGGNKVSFELDAVIAKGTCGADLTWKLYRRGELVISGTGPMTDWETYNLVPWEPYVSLIKKLTIGDDVTTIGETAFYFCKLLTDVKIGNSVTTIGESAFCMCYSLESLTIPDSVTTIGGNVFCRCTALSAVIIPGTVKTIGGSAFAECESLTNVIISNGVISIGEMAFYQCHSLASITIPDSVTTISGWMFDSCSKLSSVTLGTGITTIGPAVFPESLKTVYYAGTQEQWKTISIGPRNTALWNATIIYNYTPAKASSLSLRSASISADVTLLSLTKANGGSETLENAVIGSSYIMLIVKDANAEDLLAPDNLLYIDQKTAESETLTFTFVLPEEAADYTVRFYGNDAQDPYEENHIPGDADGDGRVSAADARLILRVAARLEPVTEYLLKVCDVDHNGSLTAVDARKILRVAAKLDTFD